jgi:nicotinamidase-related amidase
MHDLSRTLLLTLACISCGAAPSSPAVANPILEEWSEVAPPAAPEISAVEVDLGRTALLVMDFNARTCNPEGRARCHDIIPNVAGLLARAREAGLKVVYTYGPNMELPDFVPELAPLATEPSYQRPFNKFYGSTLEADLHAAGIDTVILVGTAAAGAVFATGAGAVERGFNIVVPVDGMAADTAYEEQFVVWYFGTANGFRNQTMLTRSDLISF